MLRKFIFSALTIAATSPALAQDSTETTSKPVISGFIDVYYRFNFNNPKPESELFNNYTSFTNSQNSFELGMASVKIEHSIGKVGMVADLGFGKRAEEFTYTDESTRFAIKQLYLTYAPVSKVKLTAGSWATHIGYELVDAPANRNYSMSYMFSKGPFFHTGVKADFTFGKSGFMLGFANPTDLKSANFARKFIIAQYSVATKNDNTKVYVNFQAGKPDTSYKMRQVDLVVTNKLNDKFSLGFNGTVASGQERVNGKFESANSWWGSALYVNADPSSLLGLTLRAELFNDEKLMTDVFSSQPEGGNVFATTLSANFRIKNLTIIPELRLDNASKEIFSKRSGERTKSSATALVAAVYKF